MTKQIRILIADDEPGIRMVASRALQSEGFLIAEASDGMEAYRAALSQPFDLILLDVNMDGMDGFKVTEKLRAQNIRTPILIVTGNDEEYNEVYGFSIGADDYIIKPFRPSALSARVKALLRRQGMFRESAAELHAGPFRLNKDTQQLFRDGTEIPLTPKERQLMQYFMENLNHVLTKEHLFSHVWKSEAIDDNTIMVSIRNLRQKIEPDPKKPQYLLTVYGTGYRFVVPEAASL